MSRPPEEYRPDLIGDGWDAEPLLKVSDVAKKLGVSRTTVYDLPIPRVRVSSGTVRWRPADVMAFIEQRVED